MTKVAVIGCGVVGAAIAYHLASLPDCQVTIFDQKEPGSGATQAALGVIMAVISQKTKGRAWQLRHASLQRYQTLIPELETLTGLKIPYNQQGILMLTTTETELVKWQKLVEVRAQQGLDLEIWDLSAIAARCPYLELAKTGIIKGLYSWCDRQVNPQILTQALVTGAQLRGVTCQFHTPIIALEPSSQSHQTVLVSKQDKWVFDWVVVTAGLGSGSLVPSVEINPVLGQALQLQLDTPLGDWEPVLTKDDVHVVSLGKGGYWVGATVEFPSAEGEITASTSLLEQVYQQAIAWCPGLAQGKIVKSWSGLRPRPEGRSAPVIEALPTNPRVLLATGHYRNGILLAPATAELIVKYLQDNN